MNAVSEITFFIEDYIDSLPTGSEHPDAFGQHPNADMSSHMKETQTLLDTILSLQAASASSSGAKSMEEVSFSNPVKKKAS